MNNHQKIIEYKGHLSYEEIGTLLNRMTLRLSDMGLKLPVKKRIYSVMVEILENIYKHKSDIINETHLSSFELEKEGNEFKIESGNIVERDSVDSLKTKLDLVNSLDETGLKELYKNTILNDKISEKGGAGLGIINIAKISGRKINYDFRNINGQMSYFTVNVKLKF